MPVCPNCGVKFTSKRQSAKSGVTFSVLNAAIEKRLMELGATDNVMHRRLRMWLTANIKEKLGLKRIDELTAEMLDDALVVVDQYRRDTEAS